MDASVCATSEPAVLATILLIDGVQDRLGTTARVLEGAGYRVVTGSNAALADSLTYLHLPELLLVDVDLPDGAALDLARRIKLDPRLASVFVVLVSGERMRPSGRAAGLTGLPADGYLLRSCGSAEYLDRVENFLCIREARESVRRYRSLFNATQHAFALHEIVCDEVGLPSGYRFLEVNPAFERLTGRSAAELVGTTVLELIPGAPADWTEAYGKVALSGETAHLEGSFGPEERCYEVEVYLPQPGRLASICTDVTERKQAEEALRASEERYRAMINAFDGVIYICSQDYRITFMNEGLIRLRGNVVGQHCYKALHDLDAVCPWCVNERVFRGEVVKWEVLSPKDGRWYYSINSPIRNADGTVSKQAMIHDITHLKLAEKELKFKSFTLENLAEEIIWLTPDCRILDVNRVACEKLGYSREELLSLSAWDIDPSYPKDACRSHWANLKISGSVQFQSMHKTKDGRVYPVEVTANYLNYDGHEYNCSIVRDITERNKLEQALLESEELFRTLCDCAPIGIFRGDNAGNFVYCNARCEKITGFSFKEIAGKGWRTAIYPDDFEELAQAWSQAEACGGVFSHDHRRVTPQGKTIWVRVLASPIRDRDGSITGHVGTVEDITEQRQASQEMLKTQKLESIGVLAGGIAHDFNNILTAILGNISLARFQVHDPGKVATRLEDAENAAARAKDLTQQLLTFARGGEPVKKVIEVPGLLKEAAAFALLGSNVGCVFDIAGDLWAVEADEGQLVQVIHNLMINAVQAMPEGGAVTLSAHNEGSLQQGEGCVQISVADTGAGIPEQHLERIFDPYFTTKQQGSGLGLASCYSIIKKHGGNIRAESVLGQGSTFHIVLPASRQVQSSRPAPGPALSQGSSRVLVMDDEEIVRALAKAILEQLGYLAECAADGAQAVELYRKAREQGVPFAAVILDLTVPGGVGGREAINMLLEIDPQVKAIVCSGYSTDPIMANHRQYGFSAVLAKPYRPHDLSRVLQELLGGS